MLKVVVTGASGMLGRAVIDLLNKSGCKFYPVDLYRSSCDFLPVEIAGVDITKKEEIVSTISQFKPDAVINCAAYTDVDGCETNQELAYAVNGLGAGNVAGAAHLSGAVVVHFSTDYVFGGWKGSPYRESDTPTPTGIYAKSKYEGELAVAKATDRHFILRTAWLYGPGGKNFVDTMRNLAKAKEELRVVNDQIGSPTFTYHLAAAAIKIIKMYLQSGFGKPGTYHVTNAGSCSWFEFAKSIISADPGFVKRIIPITTEELGRPAPRPRFSVLSNEKVKSTFGIALPHWEDALSEYMNRQ